jgi:Tfp pilus assembly protein PilF
MKHLVRVLRLLLAAGLFAGILHGRSPVLAQDAVERARARFEAGKKALAEGKLAAARDELTAAIDLVPRFGDAQFLLARVYTKAERWQDALDHYKKALEIGPANANHHYGIGCCERALGHVALAREAFGKARAMYPDPVDDAKKAAVAEIEFQRAAAAREDGDDDAAAKALDAGLALEPANPRLLAERGGLLMRKNDAAGAVSAYEKAFAAAPSDLAILYNLGRALVAAGRADEGQEKLASFKAKDEARRQALNDQRRRDQARSLAARAELELHEGRKESARDLAQRALAADPDNTLAAQVLGELSH